MLEVLHNYVCNYQALSYGDPQLTEILCKTLGIFQDCKMVMKDYTLKIYAKLKLRVIDTKKFMEEFMDKFA